MVDINKFNAAIALKGETKADAANIIGVNPSTLYRKLSGLSDFQSQEIEKFCSHYGTTPDIFFTSFSTQNAESDGKKE